MILRRLPFPAPILRSLSLRPIAEFLVVTVCTVAFAITALGVLGSLISPRAAGTRDFVEYWAAGQQLLHHANPYDAASILKLERSTGFPEGIPALIMPNPPSALVLVFPLGLFSPAVAEVLWVALLLGCLVASVRMVRAIIEGRAQGRTQASIHARHGFSKAPVYLLAFAFAPVLSCLLSGQIPILILLGLVLFLRLHESRPFWAGTALWLCLLKPHLFLPFGVVLLLWIVFTRKHWVFGGSAAALSVSSAIISVTNPPIWSEYAQMMHAQRVDRVLMPCFGSLLRQYVPPHTLWVQCLPAGVGCIWAVVYYWQRRDRWSWIEHGSLLMLVSVLVTPYSWFMDQTVLVPALLYAAYATRSRTMIAILALMSAAIEIETIFGMGLLHSNYFAWAAPAWLIWYLCATKMARRNDEPEEENPGRPILVERWPTGKTVGSLAEWMNQVEPLPQMQRFDS